MDGVSAWLIFFACAGVVVLAGTQLARYGDRLGDESGIGGLWIGAVLVAAATSLPEIVAGATAAWIDEPDLAVGELFGSNMANMMVLAVIAIVYTQRRVWQSVSLGQMLGAALAVALTALAASSISADLGWSIGHVGLDTIGIAVLFALGTRVVFRHEYVEARRRIVERAAEDGTSADLEDGKSHLRLPSREPMIAFGLSAALILVSGPFLASSASDIADQTGLSDTFVGATFLAITTSLPELATAIAAVRIGAHDLAVGNLFGSNGFNMFILLAVDIAYRPGPISADVSEEQVLAAVLAMFLTALGMMGIIYRAERRFILLEFDALAVIVGYVASLALVYNAGT